MAEQAVAKAAADRSQGPTKAPTKAKAAAEAAATAAADEFFQRTVTSIVSMAPPLASPPRVQAQARGGHGAGAAWRGALCHKPPCHDIMCAGAGEAQPGIQPKLNPLCRLLLYRSRRIIICVHYYSTFIPCLINPTGMSGAEVQYYRTLNTTQ